MNAIKAWAYARRFRKAFLYLDREIKRAQREHKPVAHLQAKKQAVVHEALRRAVAS